MQKVLVPIDGSEFSRRAVEHLIALVKDQCPTEIHLLNVQIPIDSGHARMFFSETDVEAYHRDEGIEALSEARAMLDREGIQYTFHILVGHVAETIARFAQEKDIDRIVMGTHGRTGLTQLLLGSVATDLIRRTDLPIALVK